LRKRTIIVVTTTTTIITLPNWVSVLLLVKLLLQAN
jgi:hypothetical protein